MAYGAPVRAEQLSFVARRTENRMVDRTRMVNEWRSTEHALAYLKIADSIPHRADGEATLLDEVPKDSRRILDLGSGDGRLLSLLLLHCASATGVALDFPPDDVGAVTREVWLRPSGPSRGA